MTKTAVPDALERYLSEIGRVPLITVAEEQSLARTYRANGETRAAHHLVTANLRFVVKIAYEYKSSGMRMADLIQEGNIGLLKAVEKFDPDRGIRLISYAVWWIRAYIQNYVLRSFSLVKLGTTQAQRKLFFALARTKRELDRTSAEHGSGSDGENSSKIAAKLKVKASDVDEMTLRLKGRDLSLDAPRADGSGQPHVDFLAGDGLPQDHELASAQEQRRLQSRTREALARLDHRERYIIERRLMSEKQPTLKEIGKHFGFSRERARQLELRAKEKLKKELHALAVENDWPAVSA
ncbi:MAG TPA: RNA polymerase factor sigma-32 [Anaeromyxobacteraceae bacterium]|nr:RNA polymerase factor sigma-32 [Anaeromyxobacteraceae bacterium]